MQLAIVFISFREFKIFLEAATAIRLLCVNKSLKLPKELPKALHNVTNFYIRQLQPGNTGNGFSSQYDKHTVILECGN